MSRIFVFFCVVFANALFAQNKPGAKELNKANSAYAEGDYSDALDWYDKSLRKIEKALDSDDEAYQQVVIYKAKTLAPLGLLKTGNLLKVEKALGILDTVYSRNNPEKIKAQYEALTFYNSIGHFEKSVGLQNKIKRHFKPKSEQDSILFFNLELEKARRNIELGNFLTVQESLPLLIKQLLGRDKKLDQIWNPETSEFQIRKLTSKEKKRRRSQLVQAKLFESKLQVDSEKSNLDSLTMVSYNWFKKNAKGGGALGQNARYIGDLFFAKADYSKARKWYLKSAKNFKKDFHRSHPGVLDAYARALDVLLAKDDIKQVERLFNKMQKRTRYYPKEFREIQPAFLHASLQTYDFKKIYTNALYSCGLWRQFIHQNDFVPTLYAFQNNKDVYTYLIKRRRTALAGEFVNKNKEWANTFFGPSLNLSANNILWADYQMTYLMDLKNARSVYFGKDWDRVLGEVGRNHSLARGGMENRGKLFLLNNEFDKAEAAFSSSVKGKDNSFSDEAKLSHAMLIGELTKLYLTKGEYQRAIDTLSFAQGIVKDVSGKKSFEYARLQQIEAQYHEFTGNLSEAKTLIKKSTNQMNKMLRKQKVKVKTDGENMALMFLYSGQYKQANKLLKQLVENREEEFGLTSPTLIKPLYYSGKTQLLMGDFVVAEQLTKRAMDMSGENAGNKTLEYLMLEKQLSEVYFQMGDYSNAVRILEDVGATQKEVLGKNHLSLANTYSDLSRAMFFNDGKIKPARKKAKEAKKIVEKVVGKTHPFYAEALLNQALIEIEDEKYPLATTYFNAAEKVVEEQFGKRSLEMANLNQSKGDMFLLQGKMNEALKSLSSSGSRYKHTFGKDHPLYQKVQTKVARAELMAGFHEKALDRMEKVMEQDLQFVEKYFAHLSEREKSKYWGQLKEDFDVYYYALFNAKKVGRRDLEKALMYRMKSKGLLFRSSVGIQRAVGNSGDSVLVAMFDDWKTRKELLASLVSLTSDEIEERGYNLYRMERGINDLEKEISESIGLSFDPEDWDIKDLKRKIGPNALAVDVIRYSSPNVSGTDSSYYGYLVVDNDEIRKTKNEVSGMELERQFTNYYRNATMLSSEDLYSYQALWLPIDELNVDDKALYFSPDGTYNQINPEMFTLPNGSFVFDETKIELLGNLSELFVAVDTSKKDSNYTYTVELIGNPLFYDEDPNIAHGPHMVSNLPGAELEVQEINTLLSEKGWSTHALLGADGTEEEVKKIKSPDVLHFATHGFFTEHATINAGIGLRDQQAIQNPLYQSGLILKDGGRLVEGESLYVNKSPGILTAYEAMNLNLENTELVVLSACETGRGEIEQGEGVYGLQRALMNAGAKSVIMSLFKVSDAVTKEMMMLFYDNWSEGIDKKAAFHMAKQSIREKYPDPKLWGSFVMVSTR
ncbi:MAG: CHAT domain-containing protein/lipopolysaccharide biosynthesis regulator YciM [Luteibaculaceae bacterium]|jgi:CHAT domain-containing protein/lipopolysaccharide biosynthesis regulator YciM